MEEDLDDSETQFDNSISKVQIEEITDVKPKKLKKKGISVIQEGNKNVEDVSDVLPEGNSFYILYLLTIYYI